MWPRHRMETGLAPHPLTRKASVLYHHQCLENLYLQIAEQVVRAHGPSGPNRDYVLNLAATMRRVAPGIGCGVMCVY